MYFRPIFDLVYPNLPKPTFDQCLTYCNVFGAQGPLGGLLLLTTSLPITESTYPALYNNTMKLEVCMCATCQRYHGHRLMQHYWPASKGSWDVVCICPFPVLGTQKNRANKQVNTFSTGWFCDFLLTIFTCFSLPPWRWPKKPHKQTLRSHRIGSQPPTLFLLLILLDLECDPIRSWMTSACLEPEND